MKSNLRKEVSMQQLKKKKGAICTHCSGRQLESVSALAQQSLSGLAQSATGGRWFARSGTDGGKSSTRTLVVRKEGTSTCSSLLTVHYEYYGRSQTKFKIVHLHFEDGCVHSLHENTHSCRHLESERDV